MEIRSLSFFETIANLKKCTCSSLVEQQVDSYSLYSQLEELSSQYHEGKLKLAFLFLYYTFDGVIFERHNVHCVLWPRSQFTSNQTLVEHQYELYPGTSC